MVTRKKLKIVNIVKQNYDTRTRNYTNRSILYNDAINIRHFRMKNLILLITSLMLLSCTQPKYEHIGQEIIDGKVSATREGHVGRGTSQRPTLWIQNATETKEVDIPYEYEGRWKVGDSCLLIIENYKEIPEEK